MLKTQFVPTRIRLKLASVTRILKRQSSNLSSSLFRW